MKARELRSKTIPELLEMEKNYLKEIFNLNMQKVTGNLSKPDQFKKVRKDIARINTIITEIGNAK